MARRHGHLKTAAELELAEKRLAAGTLAERFPQVSAITVGMTYYRGAENPTIVMVRTINYFPTSDAYFDLPCIIKECANGGFDLTPKINELIKGKKKSGSGKMTCCGKDGSHASISYEITVKYNKKS